jgi:hypothetical protein
MDLREIGRVWSGFTWLRIGMAGGLLWMRWWTFGFWRHGFCLSKTSYTHVLNAYERVNEAVKYFTGLFNDALSSTSSSHSKLPESHSHEFILSPGRPYFLSALSLHQWRLHTYAAQRPRRQPLKNSPPSEPEISWDRDLFSILRKLNSGENLQTCSLVIR